MGAACECEGSKQNEVAAAPLPAEDQVHAQGFGAAAVFEEKACETFQQQIPQELHKLRGVWKTEQDEQTMGRIEGGEVIWDNIFNHQKSTLRVVSPGRIEMNLMSQVHQAEILEGDPLRLKWSDGEIWVRISR